MVNGGMRMGKQQPASSSWGRDRLGSEAEDGKRAARRCAFSQADEAGGTRDEPGGQGKGGSEAQARGVQDGQTRQYRYQVRRLDHGFPTNPFQNDRFASANSQYENPEMCPPPNYPINLSSQPHMSKQFDSSGYCDYGYALSMQHNATDGQNDDDDEDSRGWCLASTEEDNIRLIISWLNNSIDSIDGNKKRERCTGGM
ncbi:uncharacterized protein [Triticum aestivum]|uniref:uncharacterized protein n=1 Tax=Triticum aestivum TaxID=4565 RepID=UPI001D035748|nr:uncharacterized protein LOC123181112 [Triticum aestivum]